MSLNSKSAHGVRQQHGVVRERTHRTCAETAELKAAGGVGVAGSLAVELGGGWWWLVVVVLWSYIQ